ncbi:hypothetical protein [Streptomyces sp. NPDC057909]|uniref:hypothetical protein n=1 Tax=Streptomyces sp. NPDC057909 TaxID=3346277 RepID=UPI0036ECBF66
MSAHATVGGVMVTIQSQRLYLTDDDGLGANNPKASFVLPNKTVFLSSSQQSTYVNSSRYCVGDEVVGQVYLYAYWVDATHVRTYTKVYLTEGTSCSTTDLDGTSARESTYTVPAEVDQLSLTAKNVAEGGSDKAQLFYSIVTTTV